MAFSAGNSQCGADSESLAVVDDRWVKIHPTPETNLFREILLGELGYTEGQGVYSVVRSSEAATRQLQATIFYTLINATTYQDLEADWRLHVKLRRLEPENLVRRYRDVEEPEITGIAERVFDTWRRTLQTTLLDFAHGLVGCFTLGNPSSPTSFSKYIDWLTCMGLVPVMRKTRPGGVARRLEAFLAQHTLPNHLTTVAGLIERARPVLEDLALALDSSSIADYDRTEIFYNFRRGEWRVRDVVTGLRGECLVLWPPFWSHDRLLFDSPLQRLSSEVSACHALREHAHVCRLINTAPVKVLLGRKSESERGAAGAARLVSRALGEDDESKAGSAAARLVRLIINMKSMRHVGDINNTIRSYLDEAGGHLIDNASVDSALPGFGKGGKSAASQGAGAKQQLQQAFQTSIVNNINGMLEGYINNLFATIERLRETNADLAARLEAQEHETHKTKLGALDQAQRAADTTAPLPGRGGGKAGVGGLGRGRGGPAPKLDYDIIDVSKAMDDDSYVANSFQHQYIPAYAQDLERLSRLWEHELVRCFKIARHTNNQGQETSISYSSGAIALFVAPFFSAVLQTPAVGALITGPDVLLGEEELWESIFKKTRLQTYLVDLAALFVADVQHATVQQEAANTSSGYERSRSRSPLPLSEPPSPPSKPATPAPHRYGRRSSKRQRDGRRRP
ncbi:capsid portal protein [Pteropodid alphaherpesvirus 1]|uniref:Capsid portal protein n=1 Tax=Pteropodid alphaherpesvirus 1 TaxID=1343901 RepID=A0A060Q4Y4_9ALPH|nr:capsid portal protein [Pteropodid alphaherpesvirus 1]BAP00685.1 capsid portal protein [Pteropodid alphaherpesvirus 1]